MSGKELKEIVRKTGLSNAEIARRLGVIPQNLDTYFNVSDIKTGLLERMSKALGRDITWFYEGSEYVSGVSANTDATYAVQLKEKDEQISRLLGIIEAMQGVSKKGVA